VIDDLVADSGPATSSPSLSERQRQRRGSDGGSQSVRRSQLAIVLCAALVLAFYCRCAWSYSKDLNPAPNRTDVQNLQADGVLAGRLDLPIPVPAGLKALKDPYNPVQNLQYRLAGLHDLTYYHHKIYAYFGIAPVLLFFLPYRLLGVGDLSPTLACLVFCAAGFLMSVGTMRLLVRRFLNPVHPMMEPLGVLALGLGAPIGWLVSIGRVYEVAIASGYFLVATGLFFLCRGLFESSRPRIPSLAVAGAAFASSVAARPSLVMAMGFVAFAVVYLFRVCRPGSRRRGALGALMAPVALVGAMIAWYNWARFGSFSEFGTSYMMQGENVRLARSSELEFLVRGMYDYLFAPPRFSSAFPWLRLRALSMPIPTERNYLEEPVAGIVVSQPVSVAGLIAFISLPFRRVAQLKWFSWLVATMAGIALLVIATVSYRLHGATMRYQIDYVPFLLLASVLGFLAFVRERRSWSLYLTISVAVLLLAWSIFFALSITLYPCAGTGSC
jgi:hypothetical protein